MIFLFFLCVIFSNQQYQHTKFLRGNNGGFDAPIVNGSIESSIGGIQLSTNFLLNDTIIFFFGKRKLNDEYEGSDQVWQYSIVDNQYKFIHGREETNQGSNYLKIGEFHKDNQISARSSSQGWKEDDQIFGFFGGKTYNVSTFKFTYLNDIWRFNISSSLYSIVTDVSTNMLSECEHHLEMNYPSGRHDHLMIKISESKVLLIGGEGYLCIKSNTSETAYLNDWYTLSLDSHTFEKLGGDSSSLSQMIWEDTKDYPFDSPVLGIKDEYNKNNTIGSRKGFSGLKINEEEIFIFGGRRSKEISGKGYSNLCFKYNITSNYWKYVSGSEETGQVGSYSRSYDNKNIIGGRRGHKLFQISEDEILVFAGYGYGCKSYGYLNDLWTFNLKTNLWKFSGKEITKYINHRSRTVGDNYEEENLIGGLYNFNGEYIESQNKLIICNGYGYNSYTKVHTDACWEIKFANEWCFGFMENDTNACSSHGSCDGFNKCSCKTGYFGDNCELTKCFDILSNETSEVCSSVEKGICDDGKCYCKEHGLYIREDCSKNTTLEGFVLTVTIFFSILIVIIIITTILSLLIFVIVKLVSKLKKYNEIEDIDIILEEQKITKKTEPQFNIKKKNFEIEIKDVKIEKKIGDGGSSAVVYSAFWQNQRVAYKCFIVSEFLKENKFKEFEKEVEILASLSYPYILTFFGATLNSQRIGFVMEYAENGDLENFLKSYKTKNQQPYPISQKLRMLNEISSGMAFLHEKKIMHRDLKLQNVLVTKSEDIRIMDFGLSKITNSQSDEKTLTKRIGTSFFIAPEVLNGHYSFSCDVYSFAFLMYIVLTENYQPFGKSMFNIATKIADDPNLRPNIGNLDISKEIKDVIKRNWNHDPSERMTFKELCIFFDEKLKENNLKENGEKQKNKVESLSESELERITELENLVLKLKAENEELKEIKK